MKNRPSGTADLIRFVYQRSRVRLIWATLLAAVGGGCSAALIALIADGPKKSHSGGMLLLVFLMLCLSILLTRYSSQVLIMRLTQNVAFDLRISMSRRLLATPYRRLQQLGKTGLLVILTKDLDGFVGSLQLAPRLLTDAVIVATCLVYLAWLSPQVFLLLVLALAAGTAAYLVARRIPMRHMLTVRTLMDRQVRNFKDLVDGSRELKLNQRRGNAFIEQVVRYDAAIFRDASIRGFSTFALITNIGDMFFYLVSGALILAVPIWLPQSTDTLVKVTFLLLYLVGPISGFISAGPTLATAAVALGRIQQLEHELDEGDEQNVSLAVPSGPALIQMVNVCYTYAEYGEGIDLGPLNISISPGEVVFVIGGNGSGKTTMAMLLLGLYMPRSGDIRLNGKTVDKSGLDHYRSHFGAVFSDFHLLDRLIGTGTDTIDDQAAHFWQTLGVDPGVSILGDRFSTIDVSTGQRKRLAMVSALLDDKPVYLFDEWAADQDPESKRIFYTQLLPELKKKGKTVIVITHDDAYFYCADRVVKLEDGMVANMLTK